MTAGFLSTYFSAVVARRLTVVETTPSVSNQHEFQGSSMFRAVFGSEKQRFDADLFYLTDEDEPQTAKASLTWYDSRANDPKRSAEFRLYYTTDFIQQYARAGDTLFVATREDGSVLVVVAVADSTTENQLLHLFGVDVAEGRVTKKLIAGATDIVLNAATTYILDSLGIVTIAPPPDAETIREIMVREFSLKLPDTKVFSAFVRNYVAKDVSPVDDPDAAFIKYWETERLFFDTIENEDIEQQLRAGFSGAKHLIDFAMSKLQARRSRVGQAFENHLESLFQANKIHLSRGAVTENGNKPDFIFPGIGAYQDNAFPTDFLTMLGMKTTAKDRWRQVLAEAERISYKHLATLEPSISVKQTNQMQTRNLTLVLPSDIKATYKPEQHPALLTISEFIELVNERQTASGYVPASTAIGLKSPRKNKKI